jgi:hypothetical protein
MKRVFAILLIVIVLCANVSVVLVSASSAAVYLDGPSIVRAGDTINVTLNLNGNGILALGGTIKYDTSKLALVSNTQIIESPWSVDFNNGSGTIIFAAEDTKQKSPINGNKSLFKMIFKVADVSAGSSVNINISNLEATDTNYQKIAVSNAAYSATIAPPLSTNAQLSSLLVSNANITPAFNPNITDYSASVPFDVSKIDVKATAEDPKASLKIGATDLTAGVKTKISVTVTAENGGKKIYSILVSRAADPNYVPSSENKLKGITVNGFLLSPVFNSDLTEYLVWLPYETDSISVTAIPLNAKASVFVSKTSELVAGSDNKITVTCTAENGAAKQYYIIAKRAPEHGKSVSSQDKALSSSNTEIKTKNVGVSVPVVLFLCLLFASIGAGGCFICFKKFTK